ncbi:MAG: signal peptidase I [bacterium]|nr:signal peptidase I [bacterium]
MARRKQNRGTGGNGNQGKKPRGNWFQFVVSALIIGPLVWLTGGFSRENGLEWVKSLVIAVGIALVIRWTLGEPFRIPSESMVPTFKIGDRIFVNKFAYGWRWPLNHVRIPFTKIRINYAKDRIWHGSEPKRWDIVVFKTVEEGSIHDTLVKRLVGLPGERIHIANGKVYVNGEALELPDFMPPVEYTNAGAFSTSAAAHVVPEGHYLLLGDNSARSKDGRMWGFAPNEHILGRVSCIWLPKSRWRDFTGFSGTLWWRSIVTGLGLFVLLRLFVGRSWRVRGCSLGEDLNEGDHVFINRCVYGFPIPMTNGRLTRGREPRRGEIVVYYAKGADSGEDEVFVGRMAGLPGEKVQLVEGSLTVDGESVTEPAALVDDSYASGGLYGGSKGKQYSLVPEDCYFVLGEGDAGQSDSRSLGWIPRANLVGRVSSVWWPVRRWRRLGT